MSPNKKQSQTVPFKCRDSGDQISCVAQVILNIGTFDILNTGSKEVTNRIEVATGRVALEI